ncbi:hypothetical protein LY474_20780 [Myxococcus stipitatus]|uniref:hypothetical protein n=1 Tax=Myxococcus stipitatus TaxID=83455 RepID=UPI001F1619DB|nr:hypothetical protein [Myxococcus stipitatus]MCE9670237.1 hypothetical protein [Myxococcus stipitatus]
MNHMGCPRAFAWLAIAGLGWVGAACSEPEPCVRESQAGYAARAPFDARARVRRVDCGFTSSVVGLAVAPDGAAWLRRIEYEDHGEDSFYRPPDKLLQHVGADGALLNELRVPDYVSHHVVHPSGELTILGWDKSFQAGRLVQLRRLAADGSLLSEREWTYDVPVEQRWDYTVSAEGVLRRVEVAEPQRYMSVLQARAVGEETAILVAADGIRVGMLDRSLQPRWMSLVTPTVAITGQPTREQMLALGAPFGGSGLDVDPAGGVHVAMPFMDVQRRARADAFPSVPGGPEGRSILLASFSPTGELVASRAIPAQTPREVTGLAVEDGVFAVGASERAPADGFSEAHPDLYFAAGRLDGAADAVVVRRLDIDRDDVPTAFIGCGVGRFCFAGQTAFEPSPTGPAWTESQGFVLAVDGQGERQALLLLQGPRDTEVTQASEGPGGRVVFALETDEPADAARVADLLKRNESWVGVFDGTPP